ncbi:MAG: chorismate mutase [Bacilli bacterium]|nr:chorismate mutase [Bacilli bacterium]
MDLEEVRKNIDKIDSEMRMLFIKRLEEVNNVIKYKKEHNLPILDASREKEVIEKNASKVEEKYYSYYVEFLKSIMNISKEYQKDVKDN